MKKVLIADCQALVDTAIEKFMPADQVELDKLSVEEVKARLATIESQQKRFYIETIGHSTPVLPTLVILQTGHQLPQQTS